MKQNFNAQSVFNCMNQMGAQWMNMMNLSRQWNRMNQMNRLMVGYVNSMYQLFQQTATTIYQQNTELLQKMNELLKQGAAPAAEPAPEAPAEETKE